MLHYEFTNAVRPFVIFAQHPNTEYINNRERKSRGKESNVLFTGATVLPQYYGVPWGVYPANIIQQGTTANTQQRRPLTPSSAATETANNLAAAAATTVQPSPYVIPAYYDQNGSIVMRGISNGPTMRLVSPAPVLVNPSNPGTFNFILPCRQVQQITYRNLNNFTLITTSVVCIIIRAHSADYRAYSPTFLNIIICQNIHVSKRLST